MQTFTCTARRNMYYTVVGSLGFMLLIEGGALALLIILLAQPAIFKWSLLAVCLLFYCSVVALMLTPLRSRHQLTTTHLHTRFGRNLNVTIPLDTLRSAQAVHEHLPMFYPLGAQYEARKNRIVACFSEQGQILLHFKRDQPIKLGRAIKSVRAILINVDQPDEFLATLHARIATPTPSDTTARPDERKTVRNSMLKAASSGEIAIQIEHLTRRFGTTIAVDDLNMNIRRGEIYGFLGSNGAGKTTTIKMLVGLLEPNTGRICIRGYDVWKHAEAAKRVIGYVADRALLYERLTGREFLEFLGQLRGLPQNTTKERIAYLLDLLELAGDADRLCGAYSFGMKRKLALAGALLHQPEVVILDEPLNGLDPRSARRVKDLFIDLAATGTTILLSTHDLATAGSVCHRVGIIHKGRLLAEGHADELRSLTATPDLEAAFLSLTAQQAEEMEV